MELLRLDDRTPLYVQIKEEIARDILDGTLASGSRLPSTLTLAMNYGVCHKTVQIAMKALAREGMIVRRPRLGTFVSSLRTDDAALPRSSRQVSLLVPYLADGFGTSPFVRDLIDGVMLEAENCGCQLDLNVYSSFESVAIAPTLSGFLMVRPNRDEALMVKKLGLPCLLLDIFHPRLGIGFVRSDNSDGIALAVKHLTGLGHRRLLYVHNHLDKPSSFSAADRHRAFLATVAELGLAEKDYTVLVDEAMGRLRRHDYTAVLTDGHDATVQTMEMLRALSMRFPEDVSFVGYDDVEMAEHMPVPPTVIRQKLEQIGVIGLRHLLDAQSDWRRIKEFVKPELVIRESTRAVG